MSSSSTRPTSEAGLARWARYAVRHRGRVVLAWVAVIVVLGVLGSTVGGKYATNFTIPGTESQKAVDLLKERFPSQAGDSATIVVQTDAGVNDPAVKQRLTDLLTQAASLAEAPGVVSPYDTPAAISADGKIAYATVNYDKLASEVDLDNAKQLLDLVDRSSTAGFRVEVGGQVAGQAEQNNPFGISAIVGVAAAIIILLIAFGSVVAMGLPIGTALFGLIAGSFGVAIATRFMDLNSFAPEFGVMIGLGVGIDYALFVVTRYR